MLGEKIIEMNGRMTNQRVLPAENAAPKFETSFEVLGTILGKQAKCIVTYWSLVRPDGTLYGECPNQGFVMAEDGESATFRAAGAGRLTNAAGAAAFRGALYFQSASKRLSALNAIAVVYEWDVHENGDARLAAWEWK